MPHGTRARGAAAEHAALAFLCQQGLVLHARNVHARVGEIDLVMLHRDTLVFVEVRLRRHNAFGGPLASVTPGKQQRIIGAARRYLASHPDATTRDCRFDVLGVHEDHQGRWHFQWVQAAFDTSTHDTQREWT